MKVLIIGTVLINGWKSKRDHTVVTKEFQVEALVSIPAVPRVGDEMNFNQHEQWDIIHRAKVEKVTWWPDEKYTDVMFPVVYLEADDKTGIIPDDEIDTTLEDEYRSYTSHMEEETQPGEIRWKPSRF